MRDKSHRSQIINKWQRNNWLLQALWCLRKNNIFRQYSLCFSRQILDSQDPFTRRYNDGQFLRLVWPVQLITCTIKRHEINLDDQYISFPQQLKWDHSSQWDGRYACEHAYNTDIKSFFQSCRNSKCVNSYQCIRNNLPLRNFIRSNKPWIEHWDSECKNEWATVVKKKGNKISNVEMETKKSLD